ncbi:MAG: hypothetical protein H6719_01695 [Sandaracinaceae bacterium]|nr:hypothetical protein [Sandaracinaceae bacterium]
MARGESREAASGTGAYGVWAVLVLTVIFVGWMVALTLKSCDGGAPPATVATPGPNISFAELGDRDMVAGWDVARSGPPPIRGYEALGAAEAHEMPFVTRTEPLAELCGLVWLQPEAGSRIEDASLDDRALRPTIDQGSVSFAMCGAHELRVPRGVGRARVTYWVMPGLTPTDVSATELPAEVALAFAEAEAVLHGQGWRPTRQVIRATIPASASTWEPPRPARGCVPWVIVGFGFESAFAERATDTVHQDTRAGRQLFGALSCAGEGVIALHDAGGDGGALYALPFENGGGPRVPGATGAHLTTVGELRLGTAASLALPATE